MMDWFIDNREWLFSGAGITVLAIIYGIIRWYMNKSRESHSQGVVNVTKTGPIDVSDIAGVDQGLASESDMEDAKQRLATQGRPTFISFDDIQEAIGSAPPLQRDQVKENFIGITVDWIAYLNSAKKKDNGLIGLSLSADKRKSFKFIYKLITTALTRNR